MNGRMEGCGNMTKYEQIRRFVDAHPGQAAIIRHETAIVDLASGAKVFDVTKAAATYIVETKEGVFAVVAAATRHLRWRQLGRTLGLHQIHLASPELVRERTGYDVGTVGPLFLGGVLRIMRNVLTHADLRARVMQMRRVFNTYGDTLTGIAFVARRKD